MLKRDYNEIINLPAFKSKKRKPMSLYDRAAQFAPFAALNGHEEAIKETGRIVDEKIELSDDQLADLNRQINEILINIANKPLVKVIYWLSDNKKDGGSYLTVEKNISKIDLENRFIEFVDKTRINFDNLLEIEILELL